MKYLTLILLCLIFSCSSESEVKKQRGDKKEEPSNYEKNLEYAKQAEAWDVHKKEAHRQMKEDGRMKLTVTRPLIQVDKKGFTQVVDNAKKGIAEDQYKLAMCFKYGLGIKQNTEHSLFWLKKAADQGHLKARQVYLFMLKRR